jgi:hypothetical protein
MGKSALAMIVLVVFGAACGKPAPESPEQIDLGQGMKGPGGPLKLRIVGASSEDARLPAQTEEERKRDEATVTEAAITVFTDRISLRSGPRFLVFDETVLGPPIVDGHFVFEAKNEVNKVGGETSRRAIRFDSTSRRWYIPFKEFFADLKKVDPNVEQLVTLDLELADQSRREFRIQFRALGEMAALEHREAPLPALAFGAMNQALLGNSLAIKSEVIANPSNRGVRLWIESTGKALLDSILKHRFHEGRPQQSPIEHFQNLASSNTVFLDRMEIQRTGRAPEPLALGSPQSLILGAGEAIVVSWIGRVPSESACAWNYGAIPHEFRWTEPRRCNPRYCDDGGGGSFSVTLLEQYWLSSIRVRGEIHRKVWAEELLGTTQDAEPVLSPSTDAEILFQGNTPILALDGPDIDQAHGPGPCASYK